MGTGQQRMLSRFLDIVVAWFGHRVAIWICRGAMVRPGKLIKSWQTMM